MSTRLALASLAFIGVMSLSHAATAAVIVEQNWDTPDVVGGTGDPVGTYGWAAHRNETGANSLAATPLDWPFDPVTGSGSQTRVVNDAGAPSTSDRVFVFWNANSPDTQEDILLWTSNFTPVAVQDYDNLTITWQQRDSDGGPASTPGQRAAVAIFNGVSTQWYASDLKTNETTLWVGQTALFSDSVWVPFSFDGTMTTDASGGFDVTGAAGALPTTGSIVGTGIYFETFWSGNDADSLRMDSFALTGDFNPAIPEPATAGLLALAGLALLRRRRTS